MVSDINYYNNTDEMLDKTAEATCRIMDKISMNTKSIILISIYNTELRDNQTEWRQNDENYSLSFHYF